MNRQKIIITILIALWFALEAHALMAQDSIVTGTVVTIQGGVRKWLKVTNEKDGATVNFRIGRNTEYIPHRYPNIGETVRVTYITEKGVNIATKVVIFSKRYEGERKQPPKKTDEAEDED
jgi:hypothetical protein